MSLADELSKLDALHAKGALGDEEFQRAKARLIDSAPASAPAPAVEAVNSLRRSKGDRWIAGVCGGVARATGLESWAWRLIFTVLLLIGGTGALLYVLLWLFVPSE